MLSTFILILSPLSLSHTHMHTHRPGCWMLTLVGTLLSTKMNRKSLSAVNQPADIAAGASPGHLISSLVFLYSYPPGHCVGTSSHPNLPSLSLSLSLSLLRASPMPYSKSKRKSHQDLPSPTLTIIQL